MGTSIARALSRNAAFSIIALTRQQASCQNLTTKFSGLTNFTARTDGLEEALNQSEVVIVAPKLADAILALRNRELQENIAGKLLLSVVFGLSAEVIDRELGPRHGAHIASALPSILAEISSSPTILSTASQQHSPELDSLCRQILIAFGPIIESPPSAVVASATLAGTLPALLSEYLQGLWTEAESYGVEGRAIQGIISTSLRGVAELLAQGSSPRDIIDRVATKGGVTETSLEVLRQGNIEGVTKEALRQGQEKLLSLSN